MLRRGEDVKKALSPSQKENLLTIPFESFVTWPWGYMEQITVKLGTSITPLTRRMMRKQKVPRTKIAAGIDLSIYRRCGWRPAKINVDEGQELADRRNWVAQEVGADVLGQFDDLCREYEQMYMGGIQAIPGRN